MIIKERRMAIAREIIMAHYISYYESPLGKISIVSDENYLNALRFTDDKSPSSFEKCIDFDTPAIISAKHWLNCYFQGKELPNPPPIRIQSTTFQKEVYEAVLSIPYGETRSYLDISNIIAKKRSLVSISSQAVGNALKHNPLLLLIPCHRVIGKDGSLVGYSAGLSRKARLLENEKDFISKM